MLDAQFTDLARTVFANPTLIWYTAVTFGQIPQIVRYINVFKNIFHQFWGYFSFNFKHLSN